MAKPCLPVAFLGWTEEFDILFQQVSLLDLIKDDTKQGWEKFMALKMRRLYLQKDTI